MTAYNPVNHREAKPGPLAHLFGRKERVKDLRLKRRLDACFVITNRQLNVGAHL